jgi:hypothetical protein
VALTSEVVCDGPSGNNSSNGVSVADRFGDGDDVGPDAPLLETPEPMSQAAASDLHLVGDRQSAAGLDGAVDSSKVPVRELHAPRVTEETL